MQVDAPHSVAERDRMRDQQPDDLLSKGLKARCYPNRKDASGQGWQAARRVLTLAIMGGLAVSFAGCGEIPGMQFNEHAPISQDDPNSYPNVIPITQTLIADELTERAAQEKGERAAVMAQLVGQSPDYRVQPSDVLSIIVWEHPELVLPNITYDIGASKGATSIPYVGSSPAVGYDVSRDGYIQFPYLGLVHVAGLTENQIFEKLRSQLAQYLTRPQLTIRVIGYNSQHVFVDGAVSTPSALPITDIPMTLALALNSTGGITTVGDRSRVYLSRGSHVYRIDLTSLTRLGIRPSQIPLHDGDTIHVEPLDSNKVAIVGEVYKPTTVTMRTNGRMTLSEALGEAGSVSTTTSKPQAIYVMRASEDGKTAPKIFKLDSKNASGMTLAQQFPLEGKDVIYVDTTGLVRFSRVISLLTGGVNIVNIGQVISER